MTPHSPAFDFGFDPTLGPTLQAATGAGALDTIGTPTLWAVTIGLVVALLALDFLLTRRPHEVSLREALGWSAFYIALPLAFGGWVWARTAATGAWSTSPGTWSRSRSASTTCSSSCCCWPPSPCPPCSQQRVLLYGIVGALVLRGDLHRPRCGRAGGLRLGLPGVRAGAARDRVKILRDALSGHDQEVDVYRMRVGAAGCAG